MGKLDDRTVLPRQATFASRQRLQQLRRAPDFRGYRKGSAPEDTTMIVGAGSACYLAVWRDA